MVFLDTILAFGLIIDFIFSYRLFPDTHSYWFFGLIFLALFLYLFADLFFLKKKFYSRLKIYLAVFLVFSILGLGMISTIIIRHRHGPQYQVHDIILQLESAINFFLQGKNPYAVDYFNTPVELFPYTEDGVLAINPGLYHFVMPPFYLLFSTLWYFFSISLFNFFDGRLSLLFLKLCVLIFIIRSHKELHQKLAIFFLLAFNPAMINYFMEGRSDWFVFGWLFFAFWFLNKQRLALANIFLALAFGSKQSAWPLFPFWISYLFFRQKGETLQKAKKTLKMMVPFIIVCALIFLPFMLWDFQALFKSNFQYLTGKILTSYPISGYGFGKLLVSQGLITDSHQYYPFWIWQCLFGLPLGWFLINWMKKKNSVSRLIFSYTLFLFVFWYFSRYFYSNHLGFLSLLIIAGWFFHEEK